MERVKDPDLMELTLLYDLSVRAIHVCEVAELKKLSDLHAFHKQHGGFGKLPNCGPKTVLELETLIADSDQLPAPCADALAKRIPEEMAQQIYQRQVQRLSAEARQVLFAVVGGANGHSGVGFFMRYGAHPPQLEGLKGPYRRGLLRMSAALFKDLELARQTVGQEVEGSHGKELYRWALHHSVSTPHLTELFDAQGSMTLFRFLAHYLKDLDRRTPHCILLAYLCSQGHHGAVDGIIERFGVSREYVRQVLDDVHRRAARLFRLITALPEVREHYPELVTSASAFVIDQDVLDRINARESTHWSPLFALHIMQAISEQEHVLGSWTTLLGKSHRTNVLDTQQPFLIAREVIAPLRPLLTDIERLHALERRTPLEVDAWTLLEVAEPSLHPPLWEALKVLAGICFPGIRVTDDRFILPANKARFNEDRLTEVLEKLDIPSHVDVIREVWNSSFPDHPISIGGIRSLANDHKDLFMAIGRISIYGLKRWEKERPGLKSGTIRSIIAELLCAADMPLQLEELEAQVKQYRPDANLKSILQNLKLAREFKIYPGCYVGLSNKVYGKIPAPDLFVPGSLMRDPVLIRFIDQPRSELSVFLASRCQVSPSQIERAIDTAVAKGRLVIDEAGMIRGIRSPAVENGSGAVVIPFTRGDAPDERQAG